MMCITIKAVFRRKDDVYYDIGRIPTWFSDLSYTEFWHNALMSNYKRIYQAGGTYFFTVNLQDRTSDLLVKHVELLRSAVSKVKTKHPFVIHAWVVLPEHMHCIWELPKDNSDYSMRWRLIKSGFSRMIPKDEKRSAIRIKRGERGIWQYRYWEHLIRDENDFNNHMDYVHFNPVKHGHVEQVKDWRYSSFHKLVKTDFYPQDWGSDET
jgi:putative transposase